MHKTKARTNRNVEISKEIVVDYITRNENALGLKHAMLINNGDKYLLLKHLKVMLIIVSKAIDELEKEVEGK